MWIGASGTTAIVENRNPASRAYCHPDNFKGVANILYNNNGDGTFTDVSAKAGIANPEGKGLGVSFADYDDDGFTDIFVANDSVPSFLYHNNGNGTFTEVGLPAGVAYNEDGKTFAGMGTDFSDYDNDGRADIVVTDLSNERYHLFHNNGVVSNVGQRAYVLRNDGGNSRKWLGIQTIGRKSNHDGIGCRVRVVSASGLAQYFTVNTAVGYLSASDKRLIAGLGGDPVAKLVEIRWPSGVVQRFENVKAGQMLKAIEPAQ